MTIGLAKGKDMLVDYYELSLASTSIQVYIHFTESERNKIDDTLIVEQYRNEKPIKELRIYNDGTAGFIRVSINKGPNDTGIIKIPFGENITFPFLTSEHHDDLKDKIYSITLQNYNAATTVRIVGICA